MAATVEIRRTGTRGCSGMWLYWSSMSLPLGAGLEVCDCRLKADDRWEIKIHGANGLERSYAFEGAAGEHKPRVMAAIVSKMVPGRRETAEYP
jgi:hypothetical protein